MLKKKYGGVLPKKKNLLTKVGMVAVSLLMVLVSDCYAELSRVWLGRESLLHGSFRARRWHTAF